MGNTFIEKLFSRPEKLNGENIANPDPSQIEIVTTKAELFRQQPMETLEERQKIEKEKTESFKLLESPNELHESIFDFENSLKQDKTKDLYFSVQKNIIRNHLGSLGEKFINLYNVLHAKGFEAPIGWLTGVVIEDDVFEYLEKIKSYGRTIVEREELFKKNYKKNESREFRPFKDINKLVPKKIEEKTNHSREMLGFIDDSGLSDELRLIELEAIGVFKNLIEHNGTIVDFLTANDITIYTYAGGFFWCEKEKKMKHGTWGEAEHQEPKKT